MKKTAMQQLIEDIEKYDQYFLEHGSADCPVKRIHKKATELLETERQDHERTYTDAFVNSDGTRLKVDFDEYYKDTYQ